MHTEEQQTPSTDNQDQPNVPEVTPQTKLQEPEPVKPKNRITKSVVFKPDEFDHLEQVINARKEAGRTNDWNHFIRQCIEFTVNNQEDWEFAVPKHLKNKIHFE